MARDRLLKQYLRERFVITLKGGATFDGLLDEWDQGHLMFIDAHAYGQSGDKQRVSGQLVLPRANVDYMQRLTQ